MRPRSDGRRRSGAGTSRGIRVLLFSLMWPGLGLMSAGARRTGAAVGLGSVGVVLGSLWWLGPRAGGGLVEVATDPGRLWFVIGLSGVVMVARIGFAVAALVSVARRWPVRLAPAGAALVVAGALVAAPHLVLIRFASSQIHLLGSVFAQVSPTVARPTPLPAGSVAPALVDPGPLDPDVNEAAPVEPAVAAVPAPADAGPSAGPPGGQPPVLADWHGADRLTMVFLGSDAGHDRVGVRTDTIIVLSIDVDTGGAVAFSIPRNWDGVPFPEDTPAAAANPGGFPDLANALYGYGVRRPELFGSGPDPGGTAIKQAMAQLLGLPVQYHVLVGMKAVVETVDLFGGIDITVNEHIDDRIKPIEPGGPPLVIQTVPGRHHFDGLTTLAYARSRIQSSDYSRMARQRCIMDAMLTQVTAFQAARRHDALTEILAEHVTTDIPLDELPALINLAERLDPSNIVSINFVPPRYPTGRAPVALVRSEVERAIAAQETGTGHDPASEELAALCQ